MRLFLLTLGLMIAVIVAPLLYAHWPLTPLPDGAQADAILVLKSQRKLILLRNGQPLKEYVVALGAQPVGPKQQEGDEKTPEGDRIDYRNPRSSAHRALHISYPDPSDRARALSQGVLPGGAVMIHGLPNRVGFIGRLHRLMDWTDGCIGVTNPEIEEIWRAVPNGTPIEIRP